MLFTFTLYAQNKTKMNLETATFAGGCFWCTEAVFQQVKGVKKVTSGYTGGQTKNPTYKQVSAGITGHAEGVQIVFNSKAITYKELLTIFFATHNPTTLNQQGYDVGSQYRSAIFYHNKQQKKEAEELIKELNVSKVFENPIVTKVEPITVFYKAEDYHQNYYNSNKYKGYCVAVINPKLEKLRSKFKTKLKK